MIESDVRMVKKHMNLFDKRFRSKAFSAACLFLNQLIRCGRIGFNFMPTPYDAISEVGENSTNTEIERERRKSYDSTNQKSPLCHRSQ